MAVTVALADVIAWVIVSPTLAVTALPKNSCILAAECVIDVLGNTPVYKLPLVNVDSM